MHWLANMGVFRPAASSYSDFCAAARILRKCRDPVRFDQTLLQPSTLSRETMDCRFAIVQMELIASTPL